MLRYFTILALACFLSSIKAQEGIIGTVFPGELLTEKHLTPDMKFSGTFADGMRWKDKAGENYVIVAFQPGKSPDIPQKDLYVYQYRVTSGGTSLVWKIQDFSGALCELVFIYNSLQIIDLDGDGIMEVCFMYQNQCDGSDPWQTKMMLFKDGKKLAFRGSFDPASGKEVSKTVDPEVSQFPALYRQFMQLNWDEFAKGEFEFTKSVYLRTSGYLVLALDYCFASGGRSYTVLRTDGKPVQMPAALAEKISYASTLTLLPDGKSLFYASTHGLGIGDPLTGKDNRWMTFLESTESISLVSWSPDSTRLAFTALNFSYPKRTRIFILDIKGNVMIRKQQFDVPVFYMAASDWVVYAPRLNDLRDRVYYPEMDLSSDGPAEGPEKMIFVE